MDGHASIVKAPVTTAKVETKVKSAASSPVRLTSLDFEDSNAGGSIKAWWQPSWFELQSTTLAPSFSGDPSNVRIVLTALSISLCVLCVALLCVLCVLCWRQPW